MDRAVTDFEIQSPTVDVLRRLQVAYHRGGEICDGGGGGVFRQTRRSCAERAGLRAFCAFGEPAPLLPRAARSTAAHDLSVLASTLVADMGPRCDPPYAAFDDAPPQQHRQTPLSSAQHYPTHPADHKSQRLAAGVFFFFFFFCFWALYKL
jgi:hypothetical protein